ncbi:MAG TPA: helix-turn-helix domain-containing protein [Chitinophagaceae bacterium]|nr:helix-turn-helix domain-containing protein [Chitinophagaceae bacterium]
MENFFGYRLLSARKMAGMSLQELSDKLGDEGVSRQSINKYEQGKMKPESRVLIALANALNVSADYFYSEPKREVKLEGVDYRKFVSKVSKGEQDSIEEKTKEAIERYLELEDILRINDKPEYFTFKKIIDRPEFAEEAARELREDWELGYDPIPDVVKMLEDKGYRIIEIEAPDGFDGLKAEVPNKPSDAKSLKIIVLNKNKNNDYDIVRRRFTALHELAHHALKFPGNMHEKDTEKLCHKFACAVLYPEKMARRELHEDRFHFYLQELILIKERWGISIAAIISRAKQLDIINNYVYKLLNIRFRKRGYHKPGQEPGSFNSRETPTRMERLVYLGLAKEVLTINEASHFAGISSWKLREQMNQLV